MDECKASWGNLDTTNKYDVEWIKDRNMRHESETSSMICHEDNTKVRAAWYKQMRVSCTRGRILYIFEFLTAIPLLGIIANAMITSVRKREDSAETVSEGSGSNHCSSHSDLRLEEATVLVSKQYQHHLSN